MKPFRSAFKMMRQASRLLQGGPMAEATAQLQKAMRESFNHGMPMPSGPLHGEAAEPTSVITETLLTPEGGSFSHHVLPEGRYYKLFQPGGFSGPRPLVVMLHGCKQNPDDFARGTRMNELAQSEGLWVLYPAQAKRSNAHRCWNWFLPSDQRRGAGEPALLANLVRELIARHPIDPNRVYVAGLSAGGAMAAILGHEYPDLFAASGIHSGLPQGAAHDVGSAFAAMQGRHLSHPAPARSTGGQRSAAIVFHGDADATVNYRNGEQVVAAALGAAEAGDLTPETRRSSQGGREVTCTVYADAGGRHWVEHWTVHGAGHAWSGGQPQGSFADAKGPDASREMLRFFLQHRL